MSLITYADLQIVTPTTGDGGTALTTNFVQIADDLVLKAPKASPEFTGSASFAGGAATIDSSGNAIVATVAGDGSGLTNLNASNLATGIVPTASLGTGTADGTTFLAGDQTWQPVSGGGSQDLQSVTDIGATTSDAITVTDGTHSNIISPDGSASFASGNVTVDASGNLETTGGGSFSSVAADTFTGRGTYPASVIFRDYSTIDISNNGSGTGNAICSLVNTANPDDEKRWGFIATDASTFGLIAINDALDNSTPVFTVTRTAGMATGQLGIPNGITVNGAATIDAAGNAVFATVSGDGSGLTGVTAAVSAPLSLTGTSDAVELTVQANPSGQASNIQEWKDGSGIVAASVSDSGAGGIITATCGIVIGGGAIILGNFGGGGTGRAYFADGAATIDASGNAVFASVSGDGSGLTGVIAAAAVPMTLTGTSNVVELTVQPHSSQTANIQEWKDYAGATAAYMDSSGHGGFQSITLPSSVLQSDGSASFIGGDALIYASGTGGIVYTSGGGDLGGVIIGNAYGYGTGTVTLGGNASAPATPHLGEIYFNTTDNHFYGYNGTTWVQLDN